MLKFDLFEAIRYAKECLGKEVEIAVASVSDGYAVSIHVYIGNKRYVEQFLCSYGELASSNVDIMNEQFKRAVNCLLINITNSV